MVASLAFCCSQAMADSLKFGVIGAGNVGGTLDDKSADFGSAPALRNR